MENGNNISEIGTIDIRIRLPGVRVLGFQKHVSLNNFDTLQKWRIPFGRGSDLKMSTPTRVPKFRKQISLLLDR
jgi:hypothetical protein